MTRKKGALRTAASNWSNNNKIPAQLERQVAPGGGMETLIQFQNRRRKWLRGMLHLPPRASARRGTARRLPGVVFFHGFTGDRMESHWMFVKCARGLARAGIASLRFDFYGSGESEGEFREVTLQSEVADARSAVDFLRRQRAIDPKRVGLLGLSLGGAVAARVAHDSRARALVLWAALAHPAHLRTLAKATSRLIPGSGGKREYSAHEISPRFLDGLNEVNPLDALVGFRGPTLIIHPENDAYLPLSHPEDYFLAAGAAIKKKVIIPGADHTFSSIAWEREVIARTTSWFREYL